MTIIEIRFDADLARSPSWSGVVGPNGRTAHVKCAEGHIASLSGHEIAEDGTVSPSVVCPWEGCDYHEIVQLIGWGDKPKRGRPPGRRAQSKRKAQFYEETEEADHG